MGVLDKLFETRASLENPSTDLKNPASWLYTALGIQPASSGISVSEKSALGFSPVWAAIRCISDAIAQLPLVLYRRTDRGRERATDHPLYPLMHDEPNEFMTSAVFRETLQAHVLGWGNTYALIERGNDARVRSLLPLLPDRTRPEIIDGKLWYVSHMDDGQRVLYEKDVILHIPGLGFDGIKGYSPIRIHMETIGLGMAAQKFGAKFFAQGSRVAGVIEHPTKLTPEAADRIRSQWDKIYSGIDNAHRTAVLEEGMKYRQIGIPPEEAQFIESRKLSVIDVARIYRLPPHKLGELDKATFNNVQQLNIHFVTETLQPWIVRWEQELNRKLLTPRERQEYFFKFNVNGLLRGDSKARSEFYRELWNIGVLSQNEIRELEELNAVEGGDTYFVPLNMAPVDVAKQNNRAIERLIERLARKEAKALGRIAVKLASRAAHDQARAKLVEFYDAFAAEISGDLGISLIKARSVCDELMASALEMTVDDAQDTEMREASTRETLMNIWRENHEH